MIYKNETDERIEETNAARKHKASDRLRITKN
jgi:hypothetical protein